MINVRKMEVLSKYECVRHRHLTFSSCHLAVSLRRVTMHQTQDGVKSETVNQCLRDGRGTTRPYALD